MKTPTPSYETQELREFGEILRGRRTIELFLQTEVPEALVEEAIESAIWAPNHRVTEPWHFYHVGEVSKQRCLDLCHDIVMAKKGEKVADFKRESWSEKPGWLVVTSRCSDDALLQAEDYAATCAAIQNFMLYLWKAGVGCKWTSGPITRDSRFYEILQIDESKERVAGLIWYGYPKVTPTQSRQALNNFVTELD